MMDKLLGGAVEEPHVHLYTYRDVELESCTIGRAVLIGDAAHSMSPQLGVGVQLALEDASILAGMIDEKSDLDAALREFGRSRPRMLRRYQDASRWLTPLFQTDGSLLAALRDQFMARSCNSPMVRRLARELLC
jgi:2-polyprenyl-6-methoxyphenol hydroxylase-like FAD-dependent oxidoreductase